MAAKLVDTAALSPLRLVQSSLQAGLESVCRYGGAAVGSRTMVDALSPACSSDCVTLSDLAQAARLGADSTSRMPTATHGRSAYVSNMKVNDPGAEIVAIILEALADQWC